MREEHYLSAIVRGPTPAWRPPARGLDGIAVTSRRLDDLLVLESRLAVVPPAGPRRLGAHHDVVASALPFTGSGGCGVTINTPRTYR